MYRKIASSLSLIALVVTAGCAAAPPDLDLSLTRPTVERKFVVELRPPSTPAAINQIHSWQIKLTSPNGAPIANAHFVVDGGMPQHGHGLPTRPKVTRELADGTYLLEGMKFSMIGWWEIKLAIQSAESSDKVTFNTVVRTPTAAP
jgi:YtkA-like